MKKFFLILLFLLTGCGGSFEWFPNTVTLATPVATATATSSSSVTVSWAAVQGATSYNVYWGTATGITATSTKISGLTGTSFVHSGLTTGTAYFYKVTAVSGSTESALSTEVSATPSTSSTGIQAPTGVTATALNSYSNKLNWTAVSGAGSYNIYFGTSTGVTTTNGTKISGVTGTSYTHSGIASGTTYYYIITAINNSVEGTPSAEVNAKTRDSVREIEPNDDNASANPITIGGSDVRGQMLLSGTDIDIFAFTSTGSIVTFTLAPSSKFYSGIIKVSIVAQDGTIVSSTTLSNATDQITLSGSTTAGGTYYLRFERNGNSSVFTQDYIVTSDYNPTMVREIEPNNSTATATSLTIGGAATYGQLSSETDIDIYKFNSNGSVVNFTLAPSSKLYSGIHYCPVNS